MRGVNVGLSATVELNNKVAHASLTDVLKMDLINAILGDDSTPLTGINKIVLVDSAGAERDVLSVAPTTSPANRVIGSTEFTATKSYTCTAVRLYSGGKKYFEATLPSAVSITAYTKYRVSFAVDVKADFFVSWSPSSVLSATETLSAKIANRLAGGTASVTLDKVRYISDTGAVLLEVRLAKDVTKEAFGHPVAYFTASGYLAYIKILNTAGEDVYLCNIKPILVTTSDCIVMDSWLGYFF
jgi:hypothetical protein